MMNDQLQRPVSHITITLMQTWMAYFTADHQGPQLASTQIPSQMGGWRAQQEGPWAVGAPGQSRRPVLLPYIGVQWRWLRGVIHLTNSLRVAAPPMARTPPGPVLPISTVI